jgi:hypothetical protein
MRACLLHTLIGLLACASFAGCNQGPEIVPVKGQITIEGKPLQGGTITVMPNFEGKGRAAQGTINSDGTFELTTTLSGKKIPGTYIGEHPVEISAFVFKDKKKIWYAPATYTDAGTSKLVAKIEGPTDNLKFDLKWDSEANRAKGIVVEHIQAE